MFTADQIIAHLVGDYLLQPHWMAQDKTKDSMAAALHALCYSFPFLLLDISMLAWLVIFLSHLMIDRWRLARFVVWFKNGPWLPLTATGYQDDVPPWLSVWLLIIADNTIHIIINGAAIEWLTY